MKNKKSKWDNIKIPEWTTYLAYTRFKDGRIVPDTSPYFKPPREKLEYWPNEGYKTKMVRK